MNSRRPKSCPLCGNTTPLIYMCRQCWHMLKHSGQLEFYRTIAGGSGMTDRALNNAMKIRVRR